ncbi:MAG: tetratricopeptide repeat protein [Devosia sp.]
MKSARLLLLAGVAALALSACATNRASTGAADYNQGYGQSQTTLSQLSARYKQNPRDKGTIITFAAALRASGEPEQAIAVLETAVKGYPSDLDIRIAYAKALAAAGRFAQALNIVDGAINPAAPAWSALLVKGAILDQQGNNKDARSLYKQALLIAPGEASLEANIGLSFAMTNDLAEAEAHLRKAVQMRGATSQIRQNLALVLGLQGRFDECRAMFAAELPPDQVESNMSYVRALLTQQNRWDLIKGDKGSTG